MIVLIVFAFLMVITAFFMFPAGSDIETRDDQYAILAQQMIYYHVAASIVCEETCNGPINPTNGFSTLRRTTDATSPLFPDNIFRSISQDGYVFTYYRNPYGASQLNEYNSGILSALIDKRDKDTLSWIGTYNAGTGSLNARSRSYWINPLDNTVHSAIPSTIPNVALAAENGSPVLVNRR